MSSNRPQLVQTIAKFNSNASAGILGPLPSAKTPNPQSNTYRITSQEARERREKGLCYYCDKKFIMGHRYERPQLFMVEDIVKQGIEEIREELVDSPEIEIIHEVSFHTIAGTTNL